MIDPSISSVVDSKMTILKDQVAYLIDELMEYTNTSFNDIARALNTSVGDLAGIVYLKNNQMTIEQLVSIFAATGKPISFSINVKVDNEVEFVLKVRDKTIII